MKMFQCQTDLKFAFPCSISCKISHKFLLFLRVGTSTTASLLKGRIRTINRSLTIYIPLPLPLKWISYCCIRNSRVVNFVSEKYYIGNLYFYKEFVDFVLPFLELVYQQRYMKFITVNSPLANHTKLSSVELGQKVRNKAISVSEHH